MSKEYQDEEKLRDVYFRLDSMPKTAEKFDVSTSTIKYWLDKHDIETNPQPQDKDRIEVECKNCGKKKKIPQWQFEKHENHFCNNSCKSQFEDHPIMKRGKGKVIVECSQCGSELEIYPSRDDGRNHFCDMECKSKWESDNWNNKNHHQYNRIDTECVQCGKSISIPPSQFEQSDKHFCNQECLSNWKIEGQSGKDNPNWQGGVVYYGEKWYSARRQVRKRDGNKCQLCGDNKKVLGKKPAVHHIKPVREFENPNDAHKLENMVQVCQPCHMKLEQLSIKEQKSKLKKKRSISGQSQQSLAAF